jgi:hypothetical protein
MGLAPQEHRVMLRSLPWPGLDVVIRFLSGLYVSEKSAWALVFFRGGGVTLKFGVYGYMLITK